MSIIWIIEESPNPGVWNILQSRGMYKSEGRAVCAAVELQRWHRENIQPDNPNYGKHFRAVQYAPKRPNHAA